MNKEFDILICKAAIGDLNSDEYRKWETLCKERPELRDEIERIGSMSNELRSLIAQGEAAADEASINKMRPNVFDELETARRSIFQQDSSVVDYSDSNPPKKSKKVPSGPSPQNFWRGILNRFWNLNLTPGHAFATAIILVYSVIFVSKGFLIPVDVSPQGQTEGPDITAEFSEKVIIGQPESTNLLPVSFGGKEGEQLRDLKEELSFDFEMEEANDRVWRFADPMAEFSEKVIIGQPESTNLLPVSFGGKEGEQLRDLKEELSLRTNKLTKPMIDSGSLLDFEMEEANDQVWRFADPKVDSSEGVIFVPPIDSRSSK